MYLAFFRLIRVVVVVVVWMYQGLFLDVLVGFLMLETAFFDFYRPPDPRLESICYL